MPSTMPRPTDAQSLFFSASMASVTLPVMMSLTLAKPSLTAVLIFSIFSEMALLISFHLETASFLMVVQTSTTLFLISVKTVVTVVFKLFQVVSRDVLMLFQMEDVFSFRASQAAPIFSFTSVKTAPAFSLMPSQMARSVSWMLFQTSAVFSRMASHAPVKNSAIPLQLSLIPWSRPAIRFSPISAKTVDGEWIPNSSFTPLTMGSTRCSFSQVPMDAILSSIPFSSPSTAWAPTSATSSQLISFNLAVMVSPISSPHFDSRLPQSICSSSVTMPLPISFQCPSA